MVIRMMNMLMKMKPDDGDDGDAEDDGKADANGDCLDMVASKMRLEAKTKPHSI